MDPCFPDWLKAALSVSAPCSVSRGRLWCREKCCVQLVEGAQWSMNLVHVQWLSCCIISSLPTANQVKVTHTADFSTSFSVWLTFLPNSYCTVDGMFLSLGQSFVSVCLQGQHSVLQLSCLSGCSEMSCKLNVFSVAARSNSAQWIKGRHNATDKHTHLQPCTLTLHPLILTAHDMSLFW